MLHTQTGATSKKLAVAAKLSWCDSEGKKIVKHLLQYIVQNTCLSVDKHSSGEFGIPVGSQVCLCLHSQVSRRCI